MYFWITIVWKMYVKSRVWRIYSNIQIFKYFRHKYLFGYSFVSIFIWIYSEIHSCKKNYMNIFGYSFVSKMLCEYIQLFIRVKNLTQIPYANRARRIRLFFPLSNEIKEHSHFFANHVFTILWQYDKILSIFMPWGSQQIWL